MFRGLKKLVGGLKRSVKDRCIIGEKGGEGFKSGYFRLHCGESSEHRFLLRLKTWNRRSGLGSVMKALGV